VSIGGILSEGWSIYKRLWRRSVVVAGLIFFVVSLADGLAAVSGTIGAQIVSIALSLIGSLLVQGALVEVVRDLHESRPPAPAHAYYQRTRGRLGTLLGAAILYGVGVAVGFVLLVVPGLIAIARWSLVVPLVVIEGRGWREAFARSSEIVKGRTGRVLALIVLTNLIEIAAQLAVRSAFGGLPLFWQSWIGGTVAGALVVPFEAYVLTALYYRLTDPGRPVLGEPSLQPIPE
jgi:hypothetical protein